MSDVAATRTGYINPLNERRESNNRNQDSRSDKSESTSGIASNVYESDDENATDYFRDSST